MRFGPNQIVDLLKSAMWPLLIAIVVLVFYRPLYRTLDAISRRSEQIRTIKLGQLELDIREGDLPIPPLEVASVLPSLDEPMLVLLLDANHGGGGVCFPEPGPLETNPRYQTLKKLEQINQLRMTPEVQSNSSCQNPQEIEITDNGRKTSEFLIQLLTSQVRSSRLNVH